MSSSDSECFRTKTIPAELSPHGHLVQFYDRTDLLLDSLAAYVSDGLRRGEGVIVVATTVNLRGLQSRLANVGFDLATTQASGQVIQVDAEEALMEFMVDGWPDEIRFRALVGKWLSHARGGGRVVRAFGEMVALLWADGRKAATIRLEHLWHVVCLEEALDLLCAYPKAGFKAGMEVSVDEICASHTQVLAG